MKNGENELKRRELVQKGWVQHWALSPAGLWGTTALVLQQFPFEKWRCLFGLYFKQGQGYKGTGSFRPDLFLSRLVI